METGNDGLRRHARVGSQAVITNLEEGSGSLFCGRGTAARVERGGACRDTKGRSLMRCRHLLQCDQDAAGLHHRLRILG